MTARRTKPQPAGPQTTFFGLSDLQEQAQRAKTTFGSLTNSATKIRQPVANETCACRPLGKGRKRISRISVHLVSLPLPLFPVAIPLAPFAVRAPGLSSFDVFGVVVFSYSGL